MLTTVLLPITDNTTGKKSECPVLDPKAWRPPVTDKQRISLQRPACSRPDPGFWRPHRSAYSHHLPDGGDEGKLHHRGYPIEQPAEHSSYLEVLLAGFTESCPPRRSSAGSSAQVKFRSIAHERVNHAASWPLRCAPDVDHGRCDGALLSHYHEALDLNDPADRDLTAKRVIAKMPTLAAQCYKYAVGHPFVYPNNSLGYVENFLNMMFSHPMSTYTPDPVAVKALEVMLILHADHEQNASTSTVRLSGSAGANPFACIAAGMVTLWGPAHGGANEAVLHMLNEIKTPENIPKFVARAKDKNDNFRLMGFGHRVYKNFDPRSRVIRKVCYELIERMPANVNHVLFDTALKLEEVALKDDYFIERKLYPNVDFYSGIILKALGIPESMFTVMFALGRAVGWISQWLEMMKDPDFKIGRPRQLYVGSQRRDYIPIEKRG
ncbi:MAG: citrate synthase [Gammaproteobacteria bacterium]